MILIYKVSQRIIYLLGFIVAITQPSFGQDSTYRQKMLVFYEQQAYSDAIKLIEETYPVDKPAKILSQLGFLSNALTRYIDAEMYYNRALALDSTDKAVLLSLARLNTRKLALPRAMELYKAYVAIDSTNISVYKALANLVDHTDTLNSRYLYFKKANSLNPLDAEAAIGLASVFSEKKEFQQALKILKVANEADPTNLNLVVQLLEAHYKLDHLDEVIKYGALIVESKYYDAYYLNMLARTYLKKELFDEALATIALIDEKKKSEFSYSISANALFRLNRNAEALIAVDKAIELAISDGVVDHYRYKGLISNAMSAPKEALKAYLDAQHFRHLADTEAYINIYYNIGILYDYTFKNPTEALKYYKNYIEAVKDPQKFANQFEFVNKRIVDLTKK